MRTPVFPAQARVSCTKRQDHLPNPGLAAAAPGWLVGVIEESWQQVYGQRIADIRLPASQAGQQALAVQYGKDGYHLLDQVRAPGTPPWLAELPAVQALRVIWVQQYYRVIDENGEKVVQREASKHGLLPGKIRIVSPYDLDARYSEKHGKSWLGYKAHYSAAAAGLHVVAIPHPKYPPAPDAPAKASLVLPSLTNLTLSALTGLTG